MAAKATTGLERRGRNLETYRSPASVCDPRADGRHKPVGPPSAAHVWGHRDVAASISGSTGMGRGWYVLTLPNRAITLRTPRAVDRPRRNPESCGRPDTHCFCQNAGLLSERRSCVSFVAPGKEACRPRCASQHSGSTANGQRVVGDTPRRYTSRPCLASYVDNTMCWQAATMSIPAPWGERPSSFISHNMCVYKDLGTLEWDIGAVQRALFPVFFHCSAHEHRQEPLLFMSSECNTSDRHTLCYATGLIWRLCQTSCAS